MSNNKLFMEGHELAVLNRYYIWLLNMVDFDSHSDYSKLLEYFHNKNYIWDNPMDENRAEDGLKLRVRFEDETDYEDYSALVRPCSVLEMLVAFAERIDEDILDDDCGTAYWFWVMLENLGLKGCLDDVFNARDVGNILDDWMLKRGSQAEIFPVKKWYKSGKITKNSLDEWMRFQKWFKDDEN